jgi:hypothetical protein
LSPGALSTAISYVNASAASWAKIVKAIIQDVSFIDTKLPKAKPKLALGTLVIETQKVPLKSENSILWIGHITLTSFPPTQLWSITQQNQPQPTLKPKG